MISKELNLVELDEKQKNMDILNSKINLILPELMSRNMKLGERLKNKLKVSTLFNNIEHRNKKYLKGFIFSSNKRANDLKTGLDINKAIKQSNKKLSLLYNQMKDDFILKNSDILLREKKLLNENTEQETHLKINECIHTLKNAIKSPMTIRVPTPKKLMKSMSEEELQKAKDLIGNTIIKEENDIQDRINNYINKMRISFDNKNFELNKIKIKKDFSKYAENMNIDYNIKFINYTKPKPLQIKDKENANLVRIKKFLYPSYFDIDIKKSTKDLSQNSNVSLKKCISMNDIYNTPQNLKNLSLNNKTIGNKLNNIDVNGKDTMEVLNSLVGQGEYLSERLAQKLEKVNSLIEINLPYPSNYGMILNYLNKNNNVKNDNDNNKKIELYSPSSVGKNKNHYKKIKITPFMRSKLLSLKDDIKNKRFEFEKYTPDNKSLPILNSQNTFNTNEKDIKNKKIIYENSNENNDSNNKSKIKKVFITSKM